MKTLFNMIRNLINRNNRNNEIENAYNAEIAELVKDWRVCEMLYNDRRYNRFEKRLNDLKRRAGYIATAYGLTVEYVMFDVKNF